MIHYIAVISKKIWLILVPLFLSAALISGAQAIPTATFSASASGNNDSLSISVTYNVAEADLGLGGNYYAGLTYDSTVYFLTPQGWTLYSTGPVPSYPTNALVSGTIEIITDVNLSAFVGAQLFIGYGLNESDMVTDSKYALVYTVTEESVAQGPAAVLLGTSSNFAILAKTAVSTVPTSAITGNVAVSPAATSFLTGFSLTEVGTTSATSTQVTGSLYGADMTAPTSSNLTTAVSDMETAYTDAAGRPTPDYLNLGSGNIGGAILGNTIEKNRNGTTGYSIVVSMQDGSDRTITVADASNVNVGAAVHVYGQDISIR